MHPPHKRNICQHIIQPGPAERTPTVNVQQRETQADSSESHRHRDDGSFSPAASSYITHSRSAHQHLWVASPSSRTRSEGPCVSWPNYPLKSLSDSASSKSVCFFPFFPLLTHILGWDLTQEITQLFLQILVIICWMWINLQEEKHSSISIRLLLLFSRGTFGIKYNHVPDLWVGLC